MGKKRVLILVDIVRNRDLVVHSLDLQLCSSLAALVDLDLLHELSVLNESPLTSSRYPNPYAAPFASRIWAPGPAQH